MNAPEKEEAVTLEILSAIEQKSDLSQRHIADRLGVALGLANSYLKRCTRKGLVKIKQAPANRYLYYLTPKGFAEKSRLTARYLIVSFAFYRRAGESCSEALAACRKHGWSRLVLCGASELAEIASLRAIEQGITVVGVYDPALGGTRFLDKQVLASLADCSGFDACLITGLADPGVTYRKVAAQVGADRTIVPGILGIEHALLDVKAGRRRETTIQ